MKIYNMNWQWRIYDPRKGEDFHLKLGQFKTLSTLRHNYFMVHVSINWADPETKSPRDEVNILRHCMFTPMLRSGSHLFYAASWMTHITEKTTNPLFLQSEDIGGPRIGYINPVNAGNLRKVDKIREELQSYEEWIVGSCVRPFKKPAAPPPPEEPGWVLKYLLEEEDNLGAFYYINGETYEQYFLMHPWEGIDEWFEPIFHTKPALKG
jgi:hypothetical protein